MIRNPQQQQQNSYQEINISKEFNKLFKGLYNAIKPNNKSKKAQLSDVSLEYFIVESIIDHLFLCNISLNITISIYAATQNEGEKKQFAFYYPQCQLFCLDVFCTSNYNTKKELIEKFRNKWLYQSTFVFFFQYSNQSQFTLIKLTYIYINIAILLLVKNFVGHSYQECHKKDNRRDYYYNDDESYNLNCTTHYLPPKVQGPFLNLVGILCIVTVTVFFLFEGLYIFVKVMIIWEQKIWPTYYYNPIDIKIPTVIFRSKLLCVLLLIHSFFKLIGLFVVIILTQNKTSYFLIISNLIFHMSMTLVVLTVLKLISRVDTQQNNLSIFFNHQIFIDQLLVVKNMKLKLLKFLLLITFILTIIASTQYAIYDNNNEIINYDLFIIYDCAVFQLIIVSLMLLKYLFCPCIEEIKINFRPLNQAQVMQDQEIQNNEPEQQQLEEQQPQLRMNNRNNIRLQPISNINANFIFQVEIKEKLDCVICLQQLIQNSQKDPIIQLNCHSKHIFHKKCITEWLNQIKKCPICNKEFK